jgi:hypothetical protein
LTDQEYVIGRALKEFKARVSRNKSKTVKGMVKQMFKCSPVSAMPYLERLKLDNPLSFKEKMMQKVVVYALESSGQI